MSMDPNEPLRRQFSKQELTDKLTSWMIENFGRPKELKGGEKDRWYERDGMMHQFITDLFND